ncbi:MAG: 4-hydroxyphenylpyruvate dioxygenase [Phycisphaerae bacterium]|nr:4-hydroxyphenylpyruvate dioxygenase [Saprospiraceae bacterium]
MEVLTAPPTAPSSAVASAGKPAPANATANTDSFPINGTDHLEFYVGNAKQSAMYYQAALGFEIVAYAGPETGVRDRVSYVLQQEKIRIVLTASLLPGTEIAQHVAEHGDGVKVLALWVDDAEQAFYTALSRGAEAAFAPKTLRDDNGEVVLAAIKTYGDTIHTLVERKNYKGIFMPGYEPRKNAYPSKSVGLKYVDHCVGNVELGGMDKWVKFYQDVMGFKLLITFDDKDISTEYTALMSKVVSNGNGYIKFPINEPAKGLKKSQIEEYLDFYRSAGVQHIAVATDNILETVGQLRANGVEFLYVPEVYYDDVMDRVGKIEENIEDLKALNILIDRDEDGYLLQIFTKPIQDRPTVFFEIIQRRGAKSFGKGNFKALFEAIEREQELRGTL